MPFGLATAPSIFAKLMSTVESCIKVCDLCQTKIDMYLAIGLSKTGTNVYSDKIQRFRMWFKGLVCYWIGQSLTWSQQRPFDILVQFFTIKNIVVYATIDRNRILQEALQNMSTQTTDQTFLQLWCLKASFIDLNPFSGLHLRPIKLYFLS